MNGVKIGQGSNALRDSGKVIKIDRQNTHVGAQVQSARFNVVNIRQDLATQLQVGQDVNYSVTEDEGDLPFAYDISVVP